MFIKDFFRLIKTSFNRFIFLLCIVLIGTGFLMGLSATSPIMQESVNDYYNDSNFMDLKIYSNFGFCDEDIKAFQKKEYIDKVVGSKELDAYIKRDDEDSYVARFQELSDDVNKVTITNGRAPIRNDECIIANGHLFGIGNSADDIIGTYIDVFLPDDDISESLKNTRFKVVGTFDSPEYMSKILSTSNLDNKTIDTGIYILKDNFKSEYYTCLKMTLNDSKGYNAFSDEYKDFADKHIDLVEEFGIEQKYVCKNTIVNKALDEIHEGEQELADEKAKGEKELNKAKRELNDAYKELKDAEQQIKDGEDEIASNEQKIRDSESELNSKAATVNSNIANIETAYGMSFNDVYNTINDAHNDYLHLVETTTTHNIDPRFWDVMIDPITEANYNALLAGLPATQGDVDTIHNRYDQFVNNVLVAYDNNFGGSLETTYTGIKTLYDGRNAINNGYKQIADGKRQIEDGKAEIEENKKKVEDGWKDYNKGLKEYEDALKEFNEEIEKAQKEIDDAYQEIEDMDDPKWIFLDRSLDYSYTLYKGSCTQIAKIAEIMPLLFFLVGILVCITTMTRLIQEQRTQIGTYRAIGYSKSVVIFKYICYVFLASMIGSILGIVVGMCLFPTVIYNTWRLMYILPSMKVLLPSTQLIISLFSFTIIMVFVTYFVVKDTLKEKPSNLLRPKAPKSSKPIILEKIKIIWDRISFTGKVTCRNIFRYKSRFFMTVIGVAGCTGLLILGFGIKDSISDVVEVQYSDFYQYDYTAILKDDIDKMDVNKVTSYIKNSTVAEYASPFLEYTGKIYIDDIEKTIEVEVFDTDDFSNSFDLLDYKTKEIINLDDNGVIITEKFSTDNNLKVGDIIIFESNDGELKETKITHICKTYFQHYLYISNDLYRQLFDEDVVCNKIAITYGGTLNELEKLLDNELIISVVDFSSFIASFENMIESLDLIILVIILTAGSLAFVVLFNLIEVNIAERIREIATLKVLGFRRSEIYSYIFKEIILLSVIGGLIGLVLGNYETKLVMSIINVDSIMFSCDVRPLSYVYAFLITISFTVIVLFFTRKTLNNIKMAESLKTVE